MTVNENRRENVATSKEIQKKKGWGGEKER